MAIEQALQDLQQGNEIVLRYGGQYHPAVVVKSNPVYITVKIKRTNDTVEINKESEMERGILYGYTLAWTWKADGTRTLKTEAEAKAEIHTAAEKQERANMILALQQLIDNDWDNIKTDDIVNIFEGQFGYRPL